jgi:hypothetical protein
LAKGFDASSTALGAGWAAKAVPAMARLAAMMSICGRFMVSLNGLERAARGIAAGRCAPNHSRLIVVRAP